MKRSTCLKLALLIQATATFANPSFDPTGNETIVYKRLDVHALLPEGKDAGPFVLLHVLTGQCIQPAGTTTIGNSSQSDHHSVELVLLSAGCNSASPSTQFNFTADGQVQHIGTGRCIAPAFDQNNDTPPVVLKDCSKQDGNGSYRLWTPTAEASLLHLQTGKCLHPKGGTANPGTPLLLHQGCNQPRLEFMPTPPSEVASRQRLSDEQLGVSSGRKQSTLPAPTCCTAQHCLRKKVPYHKHTFLTTVRSSKYVTAFSGLACSLAKSNPGSHLIVMGGISDSERLSAEELAYLRHNASIPGLTVDYRLVRDISFPNNQGWAERFSLNWIKLQAWNLTSWDAIIMLDADVVVLGDLKHLFHLPHHFATAPYQADGRWSYNAGGFMVLRPCRAVFEHMLSLLLEYPSLQYRDTWSEQGFLRWYFFYDTINLPMQYHANAHRHPDLGSNGMVSGLKPIALHFADKKPWEVPSTDALFKYATPCNSNFPVDQVLRRAPAAKHQRHTRSGLFG